MKDPIREEQTDSETGYDRAGMESFRRNNSERVIPCFVLNAGSSG